MKTDFRISRRDLDGKARRVVHQGRGFQSSVYEADWNGERAAVKDFSKTPPFFRFFVASFLVKREVAALKALNGTPGVPRFFGQIDRLAFALEFIEGTPLDKFALGELPAAIFPKVQAAIDAIHQKGVSHCDLKRRSNLLLTPGGEVFLIDFAAAVIGKRPFHPFANWLQKQMAEIDDKSVPRLKKFVAPELLTDADRFKLENPTRLEKLARRLLNR